MRIAWLLPGINGNLDACFRALHRLGDDQLIVYPAAMANTAFDSSRYCDYAQTLIWDDAPPTAQLRRLVQDFAPQVIVMALGTRPASYRSVVKAQPRGVLRIVAMDHQWSAKPRQWLARAIHRMYLDPVFDVVMLPSDRTEWFARRLGFSAEDVIRGSYTAETSVFDNGSRNGEELASRHQFLFAGRLVPDKAPEVLAAAYRRYRGLTGEPWELHMVGVGALEAQLSRLPGVTLRGFLQPRELAEAMWSASCFVLPSRFEPYGVVVHEAAAAGLPLLVSNVAGAAPGLLQDGYNGWTVPAERPELWARAMERMSSSSPERLEEMSCTSRALSTRLSPAGWARNMHEEIARRLL